MKNRSEKNTERGESMRHRILSIIGTILCLILLPVLIINITLIVKSYINSDEVPSVGGYLPLIVLTDSMYPQIQSGDLIICKTEEPENIAVGDVIAFFDPAGNGTSIVSHRVIDITQAEGSLAFITKGDANNTEDQMPVPKENLVGVYRKRIAGAGNVAMFFQTTTGLIVCVVLPLLLLICYDIVRRKMYERSRKQDTDALLAELEELRAQKAEQKVEQRSGQGIEKASKQQTKRKTGQAAKRQTKRKTGQGTEQGQRTSSNSNRRKDRDSSGRKQNKSLCSLL